MTWCKACQNSYNADNLRVKQSGITREHYDTMFFSQGGMCAICGAHQNDLKRSLAADHDHETGTSRGLLCNNCNIGLGSFKDDPARLRKAAEYLESYSILLEHATHEAGIIEENEPLTSGE